VEVGQSLDAIERGCVKLDWTGKVVLVPTGDKRPLGTLHEDITHRSEHSKFESVRVNLMQFVYIPQAY